MILNDVNLKNELALVHPVFHLSILYKCVGDPSTIVPLNGLETKENPPYEEVLVEILDLQVRRLRNNKVVFIKVSWINHLGEGKTWLDKADMKSRHHHLFLSTPIQA